MLTQWTRFVGAVRVGWRVFRLEWRGEWTPMLTDLQALMRKEIARETNAEALADPLRHEAFLASLIARMDLRAVQTELDELVEEASSFDGALRVIARMDAECAPEIDAAKPAEFCWHGKARGGGSSSPR